MNSEDVDDVYLDTPTDEPLLQSIIHDKILSGKENIPPSNNMNSALKYPVGDQSEEESSDNSEDENNVHYTTNCETMIHLVKANIGTGILAMPDAFKNMGLFAGLVMMVVIGVLCVHCQHVLLACGKDISIRLKKRTLTYAEVAEYTFKLGPAKIRKYAILSRRIINTFLVITQVGFCSVYFVFIATNIAEILDTYFHAHNLSKGAIMAMILPFMIVYNFIKNLKSLAPLSMLANILQTIGLVIIFYGICQNLPPVSNRTWLANYSTWPLFFGTAIYTFEGIGMVLPIENNMKNPSDFRGLTGVLNTGMVMVASCFCAVGFYGYLKYGNSVYGTITSNLPPHVLYQSVKLIFSASVFITFSLMLYVPVQIMWPTIEKRISDPRRQNIANYVFRSSLVIFSFCLAEIVPHLDIAISLVGAVGSSSLALIFPTIIDIIIRYPNNYGKFKWVLIKDVSLCIFGFFGFIVGTYATIAVAVKRMS